MSVIYLHKKRGPLHGEPRITAFDITNKPRPAAASILWLLEDGHHGSSSFLLVHPLSDQHHVCLILRAQG